MLTRAQTLHLREAFKECLDHGGKSHSKKIALIGAFYDPNSLSGLYHADESLFADSIKAMHRLKRPISYDFELDIVNTHRNHGGVDFMNTQDAQKFDVSIFCYIRRVKSELDRAQSDAEHVASSPHESKSRHSWLIAAKHRESHTLIMHGTPGSEVMANDFKGGWIKNCSPYKTMSSTPREYRGDKSLMGGKLEVLIHKDMQ